MLNYERNVGYQQKNDVPLFVNWFGNDMQDLKRGGTAPTTETRKNRNIMTGSHMHNPEGRAQPIKVIKQPSIVYNSIENLQKNSENKEENTFKKSMQTITKIYSNTPGMPSKPKRGSFDGKNNVFNPFGNSHMTSSTQQPFNVAPRKLSASINASDLTSPVILSHIFENLKTGNGFKRPQTSHKKVTSAYRRDRMTNEQAVEIDEFTPNTGNLELESLHQFNNEESEFDLSPLNKEIIQARARQREQTQTEETQEFFDNPNIKEFPKKRHHLFDKDNSDKGDSDEEGARKSHPAVRYSRARQILESRKYAEDYKNIDIFELEVDRPVTAQTLTSSSQAIQKQKEDKENLLGLHRGTQELGEGNEVSLQEAEEQHNKSQVNTSHRYHTSQGAGIGDEEANNIGLQPFSTFQRPPTRKIGQAMNLDDRFGAKTNESRDSEIKIQSIPVKPQQIVRVRPPSRHKTPSKDLPDKEGKDGSSSSLRQQNEIEERELGIHNYDSGSGSELDTRKDDDFNHLFGFAEMEAERNNTRPRTSAARERKPQTAQPFSRIKGLGETEKPTQKISSIAIDTRVFPPQKIKQVELDISKTNLNIIKSIERTGAKVQEVVIEKLKKSDQPSGLGSKKPSEIMSSNRDKTEKVPEKTDFKSRFGPMEFDDSFDNFDFDDDHESKAHSPGAKRKPQTAKPESTKTSVSGIKVEKLMKNNFLDSLATNSYKDEKSNIVFTHNKSSVTNRKSNNISLPFETSLGKDFVGLFANQ